jgi:hypothetical protein
MKTETIVSDMFKLALLDLYKLTPKRVEYKERYEAYFDSADVDEILLGYESGTLQVEARAFADSIDRTKDRIFAARRAVGLHGRRPSVRW